MPYKPEPKRNKLTYVEQKTWNSTNFKYNSADWIKLRNLVRQEEPLCRHCKIEGKLTPTQVIDHIQPISQGGEAWDRENLQGLCNKCHSIKTQKEMIR
jgi:5-methylcytosine-specific restriction enzyme A